MHLISKTTLASIVYLAVLVGCEQPKQKREKAAPPPPSLHAITTELSKIKTMCEDRAQSSMTTEKLGRFKKRKKTLQLKDGQDKYIDARTNVNALIANLRTGVASRFKSYTKKDLQDLSELQLEARQSVRIFLDWTRESESAEKEYGRSEVAYCTAIGDPFSALAEIISTLIKTAHAAEQAEIDRCRIDLGACELRSWRDLTR